MKKLKSILSVLALLTISLASCEKDGDKEPTPDKVISSAMTFKLDGDSKQSTILLAAKDDEDEGFGIVGTINNSETLMFAFEKIPSKKNYSVSMEDDEEVDDQLVAVYTNGNNTTENAFIATAGNVTITSITDKVVKGTFQLTLKNSVNATKTVTDGKFEASIVEGD